MRPLFPAILHAEMISIFHFVHRNEFHSCLPRPLALAACKYPPLEKGQQRIVELDRLIEKIYEDNALGRLSDERYARMMTNYEKEQKMLMAEVEQSQKILSESEQQTVDMRLMLRTLRELTDVKELTPTLVNSLIQRIEVHSNDKSSGHCCVKVDIYFTAVGMIDIPTEKEIRAMMKEIQENPQDCQFIA